MNRIKAVQQALAGRAHPTYLEIGVNKGFVFRQVRAADKLAVDPVFKMSDRTRRRAAATGRTHYFPMTSDEFFASEPAVLRRGVDVALIDGLHTRAQALRDVENTLRYLRDGGVIVMHDCNPRLASIGYPAESLADFRRQSWRWIFGWSGDVWKAIVALRTRGDLQVAVLDCDWGVGLVQRGVPERVLPYSPEQIVELDYSDLAADRQGLLNLRPGNYLREFLATRVT